MNDHQQSTDNLMRSGSVEPPPLHFQETMELELRSHLESAKNDLNQVKCEIEHRIKQEINKYPQFAEEESAVSSKLNLLQQRFDVFEDEIIRRTQDMIRGYHQIRND